MRIAFESLLLDTRRGLQTQHKTRSPDAPPAPEAAAPGVAPGLGEKNVEIFACAAPLLPAAPAAPAGCGLKKEEMDFCFAAPAAAPPPPALPFWPDMDEPLGADIEERCCWASAANVHAHISCFERVWAFQTSKNSQSSSAG